VNDHIAKLGPVVSRPEWDMFLVYISYLLTQERENLEMCHPEFLRQAQARVAVYKDLLTLRETVSRIIRDTKTQ